jgi:hypothetical protein
MCGELSIYLRTQMWYDYACRSLLGRMDGCPNRSPLLHKLHLISFWNRVVETIYVNLKFIRASPCSVFISLERLV